MFPSLVNCCTIDWFTEWPPEALLSVSKSSFEHIDLGTDELKVCEENFLIGGWFYKT
jgi:dynein heavy chain